MMITLIILVILIFLCVYGLYPLIIVGIMLIIYWLPKFIVINALECLYPKIITRNPKSKYTSLTFDDMPNGNHKAIIEILDSYGMKGTFFIISGQITTHDMDIFIDAVKNGHQLANHGHTDSAHFLKIPYQFLKEITKCDNKIKEIYTIAGVDLPKKMFYRPGCGVFNRKIMDIIPLFQYKLALGSVYPNDPLIRNSNINYWYLKWHIDHGDAVVLHDRPWTPPMLKKLCKWMQQHGLKSVTMDELFNY